MDWNDPKHLLAAVGVILAAVGVIVVLILGLYYVTSPYQNCVRTHPNSVTHCTTLKSW
jgi:hypothetical protein